VNITLLYLRHIAAFFDTSAHPMLGFVIWILAADFMVYIWTLRTDRMADVLGSGFIVDFK
jgi:hypothetical protein